MTKLKKRMAFAAIAAVGCLAGIAGFHATESESKSALTLANIEALSAKENNFSECKDGCSTENNGQYCCSLFGKNLYFPKTN